MQAQKVGLRKVRDLEDMIGKGAEIRPIERPYMRLADDPRVLAYSDLACLPTAVWTPRHSLSWS